MRWMFLVILITMVATSCSAKFPDVRIPDCLGVQGPSPLGSSLNPAELDSLASAGFKLVRMDLQWEAIEKRKGMYDFVGSNYDRFTDEYTKRKIRILYIIDYGNRLYETTDKSIRTEEGRKAFALFAQTAAKRYAGRGIIYEIWNEPNIFFWDPQPSADDYVKLVEETAPRIRAADPTAMIICPASSGIPFDFMQELFRRGLLQWIDGVSVHPYRADPPETVIEEYSRLRLLIQQYAPRKKSLPILSTEWGYSLINWDRSRLTEDEQANRLVRMFLVNMLENVPISIWFDWKDWGTEDILEHHSGIMLPDGRHPKKAYYAVKTLSSLLRGARLRRRLNLGKKTDFVLEFSTANATILVCWSTDETHEVLLAMVIRARELYNIYGERIRAPAGKCGDAKVSISQSPIYLVIRK